MILTIIRKRKYIRTRVKALIFFLRYFWQNHEYSCLKYIFVCLLLSLVCNLPGAHKKHGGFWPNLRHFGVTISLCSCRTPLTKYLSGKNLSMSVVSGWPHENRETVTSNPPCFLFVLLIESMISRYIVKLSGYNIHSHFTIT